MLIQTKCVELLSNINKLTVLIMNNLKTSSQDKVFAKTINEESKKLIGDITGQCLETPTGISTINPKYTNETMSQMASAIIGGTKYTYDLIAKFGVDIKDITFLHPNFERRLAYNTFNMKDCHIEVEFGNYEQAYYVVSYKDGTFAVVTEKLIRLK